MTEVNCLTRGTDGLLGTNGGLVGHRTSRLLLVILGLKQAIDVVT